MTNRPRLDGIEGDEDGLARSGETTMFYIKQVGHQRYAYFDMSGAKPVIKFTVSLVLAYPFCSHDEAVSAARAYLSHYSNPCIEIVKQ